MSEAIQQIPSVGVCDVCGKAAEGTKAFILNPEDPEMPSVEWCSKHAREVVDRLNSAFDLGPDPYPAWVKRMQNIGTTKKDDGQE